MAVRCRTLWGSLATLSTWLVLCVSGRDLRLIQTLEDEIGAENFTFYKLQRQGNLLLELISLHGDVDIYISSTVPQPDYANYDLKSETCGLDVIQIPGNMLRPVYISVFGHPNNLLSKYRLSIFEVDEVVLDDYEAFVDKYERYYYEEMDGGSFEEQREKDSSAKSSSRESQKVEHRGEEELPMWWNILINTLKFLVEVIL